MGMTKEAVEAAGFDRITPEVMLAATKKLVGISRGDADPDDRDSLANQTFHGPEDFFTERIAKDAGGVGRNALWKSTYGGKLSGLNSGALTPQLRGVLIGSGMGTALEEINPLETYDQQVRMLRLGEGGIPDVSAIPEEAKNVQASQFGFIDPLRGPECFDPETEVMTIEGWVAWPDVTEDTIFKLYGRADYYGKASRLIAKPYKGTMYGVASRYINFLVTPGHRLYSRAPDDHGMPEFEMLKAADVHQLPRTFICHQPAMPHVGVKVDEWFKEEYDGIVYCATVPGSMLLVRRGSGAGHWSGNSEKLGVDSRLAFGTYKGNDGHIYSNFTDVRTGKSMKVSARDASKAIIAFPGEMGKKGRKVRAMAHGKLGYVDKREVDYELPHSSEMFNMSVNLVPMPNATQGNRLFMAGKSFNQALALQHAEAPLVQSGTSKADISFDSLMGNKLGVVRSEQPGQVTRVGKNGITVKHADGTNRTYETYDHFPLNRKSYLHNTAQVKAGDKVGAGHLLASSNFTDKKGEQALGTNLRVAFMPFRGLNYEDAFVISESGAKKLSAEHMYTPTLDIEKNMDLKRNKFLALFPGKYNKDQLGKIGKDGLIAVGSRVQKDDPLILAVGDMDPKAEGQWTSIASKASRKTRDRSVVWDHDAEGIVTDAVRTKDGVSIAVKAYSPMEVGNKLCYSEDTEVLTTRGWVLFRDLLPSDQVATLLDGHLVYLEPEEITSYRHDGRMYHIASQQVDMCVTDDHRQWVQLRGKEKHELIPAKDIFGKRVRYQKDARWAGWESEYVTFPALTVAAGQSGNGTRVMPELRMETDHYLMLLGMYLAEGNIVNQPKSGSYGIDITQIKPKHRKRLLSTLREEGIKFGEHSKKAKIRIYSKQLMLHFSQFGKCCEKFIPEEVFAFSSRQLRILLDWLMWGDGHCKTGTKRYESYFTTSKRLADDVQRLCLHVGYAANVYERPEYEHSIGDWSGTCRISYRVAILTKKLRPMVNHSNFKQSPGNREEWVDYNGWVWCCRVPAGHVIYVRRNGKPTWSGNTGRYGDKGVVAKIIPDDEMPHDSEGRPFHILQNPTTLPSRMNTAQMYETFLSKIARKTGKPVIMPQFQDDDLADWVEAQLKKHGLSDTDTVNDPNTGRDIKDVATGEKFYMQLHHSAESKAGARETGGYTAEGVPAHGGKEGAKTIGGLGINALLSSGATAVIRDTKLYRGQRNDDFWRSFKLGYAPPPPKEPLVYKKFLAHLKGAGINVTQNGEQTNITAMTDKDVDKLSGGEITSPDTVDDKTLAPKPGGLFDRGITGSHGGSKWSHIKLAEPIPNPVMEEPIRRLLGLTQKKLNAIVAGDEEIRGKTGGKAIQAALARINVKEELAAAREEIKTKSGAGRDNAIKRLRYLEMSDQHGIHPKDFVISKVPVIPPNFRPISQIKDGMSIVSDANYLYQDLLFANEALRGVTKEIGDEAASEERKNLYAATRAVVGIGDPISPKLQEKKVGGLLKHVFGKGSPKLGMVQKRVIGMSTDVAGRAVITPNPKLDMDQVGLPEDKAWTVYKPFILRQLVKRGTSALQAAKMVEDRNKVAKEVMLAEMEKRPVLITRAPVLTRYGMLAAFPKLTKSKTLELSPITTTGPNADFDGDTMSYHVPVSDEAVAEAKEKMLPSKQLRHIGDFKAHYIPTQEYIHGLYQATAKKSKRSTHEFATQKDAVKAYRRGEIDINDEVIIRG